MSKQIKTSGLLALLMAGCLYGLYGILSRLIGNSFGSFSQNWIRNLMVAVIIVMIMSFNRTKLKKIENRDVKWLVPWVLCGSWLSVLTFIAFNNLPIGMVYLVIYSVITLSGFVSGAIFFKEKMNVVKFLSLALAVLGIVVVFSGSTELVKSTYVLLTAAYGITVGFWNTISKKFSDHYPKLQLILLDSLVAVVGSLGCSFIFNERWLQLPGVSSWIYILIYAGIQVVTIWLVIYGFSQVEAQVGSIVLPVEIVFALIFAGLFFKEVPGTYSVIGGILIIMSAIMPSLWEIYQQRKI